MTTTEHPRETTAPTPDQLSVGDIVRVVPWAEPKNAKGALYRVESVPLVPPHVDYVVSPVVGGRGVRAGRDLLVPVGGEEAARARLVAEAAPTVELGSVVAFKAPRSAGEHGLFVVVKLASGANVAKLGGEGNRYFRSIPLQDLRVVPVPEGLDDAS